jgi:hypothetical protein
MRPIRVTLNAAGYSQWIPIDYVESWFGVGLAVVLSEDGNLTYSVQFTLDETRLDQNVVNSRVTISRTTTVATVTDAGPLLIGHGLTTGDSVIIKGSGSTNLDSAGPLYGNGDVGFNVASTPSTTTFTYAVASSGASADTGNAYIVRLRVFTHATLAAQTTRQNGSLNYPVKAVRLYVSAYTAGYADLLVLQGVPQ